MSSGPTTRTRVTAGAIARARKPSGRLNTDDLKSAQKAIATTPKKELIKELEKNRKRKTLGFTTGKQTGVAMHHPKSEPKINKAYKGASKNLKRKK